MATPVVWYLVEKSDGKFLCDDRHSNEPGPFWGTLQNPFLCRFDTVAEATKHAMGGTIRVMVDDRLV